MESDHRGHGVVLSDNDRWLIDAALEHYAKTQGFEVECAELRGYLLRAW